MYAPADHEDMNTFSPDPEDRDAARVRAELLSAGAARSRDGRRDSTSARRPSLRSRFVRGLRAVWRDQVEAQERLDIINRPWIHDNAHWHELEDGSVVLHGEHLPAGRRSVPMTAGGWCPSAGCRIA